MMLKNNINIIKAIPDDAVKIAEIEKRCFSSPWSENQIREEIQSDNVIFLVAKNDNELCGYISGKLILDEFYISNIAVSEAFRNQNIGTSLLNSLLEKLEDEICTFATLEVRESNTTARHLYEKMGFYNLGTRKNFYTSPTENACIYTFYFKKESENLN